MNLAPGSMQFFEVWKILNTKFLFDGIIVEVTEQLFRPSGEKEMAMHGIAESTATLDLYLDIRHSN